MAQFLCFWLWIYYFFLFVFVVFWKKHTNNIACFSYFRYRKSSQIWNWFLACVLCLMRWHGLKKMKDCKRIAVVVVILLSIFFITIIDLSLVSSLIQVSLANTPNNYDYFFFQKTWSNGSWGNGWPWVYTSNCAENPISSTSSQLLWPAWVSFCPFCLHFLIPKLLIPNCFMATWLTSSN